MTKVQTVANAAIRNMNILAAATGGVPKLCKLIGMSKTSYYRRLANPMSLSLTELLALSEVANKEGLPFNLRGVDIDL